MVDLDFMAPAAGSYGGVTTISTECTYVVSIHLSDNMLARLCSVGECRIFERFFIFKHNKLYLLGNKYYS